MTTQTRRTGWLLWCLAVAALAWPVAAEAQSDTVVYYYTEAVGTVRMTTDGSGAVLARYDDPPFGAPSAAPPPPAEPRRFAGKERDAETGLDYFGARHYSNQTGRFTTVDGPSLQIELAMTNPQRWNRYAYAGNNPLRFVDPDGADFWDFVNGVSDAMRANFALGIGRSAGGNSDFVIGQRVGDLSGVSSR